MGAALLSSCSGGAHPAQQLNALHVAHNAMSDHLLTVNLGAEHHSDQYGSASIGDAATVVKPRQGVDVSIRIHNEPHGASERAYLEKSNCAHPGATPWEPLASVTGGRSKTKLSGLTVARLKDEHFSVVVDQGHSGHGPIVSCGDFSL